MPFVGPEATDALAASNILTVIRFADIAMLLSETNVGIYTAKENLSTLIDPTNRIWTHVDAYGHANTVLQGFITTTQKVIAVNKKETFQDIDFPAIVILDTDYTAAQSTSCDYDVDVRRTFDIVTLKNSTQQNDAIVWRCMKCLQDEMLARLLCQTNVQPGHIYNVQVSPMAFNTEDPAVNVTGSRISYRIKYMVSRQMINQNIGALP